MARKRIPFRFDELIDAATDVFASEGFARARIERIARHARCATGTVYLYAAGKEALFDLALRRALEDPTALAVEWPAPQPSRDEILVRFQRCLHGASHLPHLWVASERPDPEAPAAELEAVLRECWRWLARYRRAILMVRASAADWPGLVQRFEREFLAETGRRLASYLQARAAAGLILPVTAPASTAQFILATLAASALGLGVSGEASDRVPGARDEDAAVGVLVRGLVGG